MSDESDNSRATNIGQEKSHNNPEDQGTPDSQQSRLIEQQIRYFTVAANIGQIVFAIISGEVFAAFAARMAMLAKATFIPDSGSGNTAAAAFWLNLTEAGMLRFAKRRKLPVKMPGDERLYRFGDITGDFISAVETEAPPKLITKRSKKRAE